MLPVTDAEDAAKLIGKIELLDEIIPREGCFLITRTPASYFSVKERYPILFKSEILAYWTARFEYSIQVLAAIARRY